MQAHQRVARFAHPVHNVGLFGVESWMIVADFGAGSGHYALHCAKTLADTGRVYAIDVQSDLLRRIQNEAERQGLKNIETVLGDVEQPHGTKLADDSVDRVIMSNVLFQLEHPRSALLEARRIVKPSGKLVIIDWTDSFRGMGPTKEHVVKKEKAIEYAEGNHFKLLSEFTAGAHHYGLMFEPIPRPLS